MTKLLTETELTLMNVLWDLETGTVREVHAAMEREVAYTTVATVLKIMADKGFISSTKKGRALVYSPSVPRESYEKRGLSHLVQRVFGGDPLALVRSLVSGNDLSDDELSALEALVDDARRSRDD
ncbi:MAG: BlaI/MecI/CopY family transcriptional regulator [Myxococcota bacterium]